MRNTFSSGHFIKGFAVFMFVSLSCLFFPITVNAGSDSKLAEEYFVKAALLINFTKLIQWPTREFSSSDDSLKICIIGEDPFGNALDVAKNITANNRKLDIRRLLNWESTSHCHIAFISTSEEGHVNSILGRLRGKAVLTISDIRGIEKMGGMIAFFPKGNKVGIRINIESARRANLNMSSHLLEAAEIVPY